MPRSTAPVPEELVRLRVNGLHHATWTASPAALEALGAGRLMAAGFVRELADLREIRVLPPEEGVHGIDAAVDAERAAAALAERDHRREHGCGLRFLLDCRPDLLPGRNRRERDPGQRDPRQPGPGDRPAPDLAAFPELFRELFDRSPSRTTTGGHHTAGLAGPRGLVHVHEEVGRHNAADKAIGAALLAGDDLRGLGMVTTARISGQIAEKAARAGLAWVASRSVPTTLAVTLAAAAALSLVARAPGHDARIFP